MSLMSVAESACHLEFREVIVRVPSQAVLQNYVVVAAVSGTIPSTS